MPEDRRRARRSLPVPRFAPKGRFARILAPKSARRTPAAQPTSAAPVRTAAEGIARNTAYALLAQITTGVFTTLVTLYLARTLGPGGFGLFALALGVGQLAIVAGDAGIPQSVARFLAESRSNDRAVTGLLADALRLKVVIGALVSVTLVAAAGPLADAYDEPGLTWPLRAIAVSVFAEGLFGLYLTSFIALGRNAVNARLILFESMAEAGAIIALVALGAGAAGATFGRSIGYMVGAGLALVVVARLLGRGAVRRVSGLGRTREIGTYAAPLLVTSGVYGLYTQVDVLIIGALLGPAAVGVFAAPRRLTVPLAYLGQAVANSVAPRQASGASARRDPRAFTTSLRWLAIVHALPLAPIVVWAEPICGLLFGPGYEDSANVLRLLALFIFLRGLSPLISTTVNYLGHASRRIPIVLAALAVNVALDVSLLPVIGVAAAAIGVTVAYVVYVAAHLRICIVELGLETRRLALTFLRALAAAGAAGAVLLLVGPGPLSVGAVGLGAAGGLGAFVAVLVLSGEIQPREMRHARAVTTTRLSRLLASPRLR